MGIHIQELTIEVTRRCNLECPHCLRGDIQKRNIPLIYVENVFKEVDSIGTITFTGGEPFLVINRIEQIMNLAKMYNVEIQNFYIATNGTINTKKVLKVLMDLYIQCTDNEISAVEVSTDQFHIDGGADVDFYSTYLSILKFVRERDKGKDDYRQLKKEGRNKYTNGANLVTEETYSVDCYNDTYNVEGIIYINAKGEIIAGCDWSYESQKDHVIGNCKNEFMMKETGVWHPFKEWLESKFNELVEYTD
jgi:organic radical activating enzyme